jgi:hypothetical protein
MPGVTGLGQRALAGAEGPQVGSIASSLDALGFQVNAENVLQIRTALLDEASRLDGFLGWHGPTLRVRAPAPDPVSGAAEELLNLKIDRLRDQFQAYVDALKAAGGELEKTARSYGYTEQQIKDSFDPGNQICEAEGTPM